MKLDGRLHRGREREIHTHTHTHTQKFVCVSFQELKQRLKQRLATPTGLLFSPHTCHHIIATWFFCQNLCVSPFAKTCVCRRREWPQAGWKSLPTSSRKRGRALDRGSGQEMKMWYSSKSLRKWRTRLRERRGQTYEHIVGGGRGGGRDPVARQRRGSTESLLQVP